MSDSRLVFDLGAVKARTRDLIRAATRLEADYESKRLRASVTQDEDDVRAATDARAKFEKIAEERAQSLALCQALMAHAAADASTPAPPPPPPADASTPAPPPPPPADASTPTPPPPPPAAASTPAPPPPPPPPPPPVVAPPSPPRASVASTPSPSPPRKAPRMLIPCGVGHCSAKTGSKKMHARTLTSRPHACSGRHMQGAVIEPAARGEPVPVCDCEAVARPAAFDLVYPPNKLYSEMDGKLALSVCSGCRRVRCEAGQPLVELARAAAAMPERIRQFDAVRQQQLAAAGAAAAAASIEQLRTDVARLSAANARLQAENDALKRRVAESGQRPAGKRRRPADDDDAAAAAAAAPKTATE